MCIYYGTNTVVLLYNLVRVILYGYEKKDICLRFESMLVKSSFTDLNSKVMFHNIYLGDLGFQSNCNLTCKCKQLAS